MAAELLAEGAESQVAPVWEERCFLYQVFQSVFGNAPSVAQLDVVFSDLARESLGAFADADDLALLDGWAAEFAQDPQAFAERLGSQYMRALIGPASLPAPPWESVYTSNDHLLFQEVTLDVRRAYVAQDCIPASYPHVADDHLSLELDFMAKLAERAMQAVERGDGGEVGRLVTVQLDFLHNHLGVWVGAFAERLATDAARYYACMARLTERFVAQDLRWLEEFGR